jgi:hypothetical protein
VVFGDRPVSVNDVVLDVPTWVKAPLVARRMS